MKIQCQALQHNDDLIAQQTNERNKLARYPNHLFDRSAFHSSTALLATLKPSIPAGIPQ